MENKNFNYFQALNWLLEDRFLNKGKGKKATPQEAEKADGQKDQEKAPDGKAKVEEGKTNAKKEGVEKRSEQKRAALRETEKLPPRGLDPIATLDTKTFIERASVQGKDSEFNKLDLLEINPRREGTHIDSKQWDSSNLEGIDKIEKDCNDLGITAQSPEFYKTLFSVLRNGVNPATNDYLAHDETGKFFQDPVSHLKDIEALPAKGDFKGGEQFVKAWEFLNIYLRGVLGNQDAQELKILADQEGLDSDIVAEKVVDFGRTTFSSIKKAANERDYATLGMYAVGAYAFYKVYQKLVGGHGPTEGGSQGDHFDWKKWLLYGTATYAGYHFAKKAGYDPLKWLGLKDKDAEIKGTPMEKMRTILNACPELKEDDKDIDSNIVMRIASANLLTLHELRKQANNNGIHEIDPREFPDIFTDLADVPPFKMGQGEEGIKDNTGMSNIKLTAKQREYVRVSQQLFKIAIATEKVYDKTLKKYHPAYKGIPYEAALTKNTDRQLAKLWHLFSAMEKYAVKEPGTFYSRESLGKVREKVSSLFEKVPESAAVVNGHVGGNHFEGTLQNFPVVFVMADDTVQVYLRNNYGSGYQSTPGPGFSAEIPLEGGNPQREAEKAVAAVGDRMRELIKRLQIGKTLTDVDVKGGKWQCKIAISADIKKNFNVVENDSTGFFQVYPDGNGVTLVNETGGVVLDSNESLAKQNPAAFSILSRFKDQPKFKIFAPLYRLNRLNFVDENPSDNKFTIKIGKKGGSIEVQYDKTSKSFSFVKPEQEQELLKPGSGFADELKDALREDDRLKHILKSWRDIVGELDEDYLFHFFKSVPDWFTKATSDYWTRGIKLKDFTGSIAKNYTSQLLDAQVNLVLAKVAAEVEKSGDLSKASAAVNDIFGSALNDLTFQRDKLSGATTEKSDHGKKFSEDEFKEVITGVAASGIKSNDYKSWYKQFVDYVFLKYGKDDLREGRAIKSKDVISVFAYYTAVCDDPDMDGADLHAGLSEDGKKVRDFIEISKKDGRPPNDDEMVEWGEHFEAETQSDANEAEIAYHISTFKEAHIGEPFDDEIANGLNIDISKIPSLKEEIKSSEKASKYQLYRNYVNYVVSKIQLKYTEGRLADTIPPPGGFWEIKLFDEWKRSPESTAAPEFIDTREPLTMSKDYVSLDKYLALDNNTEKAKVDKSKLILPRSYVGADGKTVYEIKINFGHSSLTNDEKKIMREVLGASSKEIRNNSIERNHEILKKTSLEEAFTKRMAEAFKKMERDYHPKGEKFKKLKESYLLGYSLEKQPNGVFIIKYNSSSIYSVSKIEGLLEGLSTITKSDQKREIDNEVERIVKSEILNDQNFDTYFNRKTLGKSISSTWDDFTSWLLG